MDKRIFMLLGAIIIIGGVIFFLQRMLRQNPACTGASISATSKDLIIGDSLRFSDSSTDAAKWFWDFGDGVGTSDSKSGSYLYQSKGTYIVRLTINDNKACMDSIQVTVSSGGIDTVIGPKISITANKSVVFVGEPVNFKGSAEGAKSWKWFFGENGTMVDAQIQNPTYTYKTQGDYVVTLKTDASLKVNGAYNIKVLPRQLPTATKTVTSSKDKVPSKPKLPPKTEIIDRLQKLADRGGYKSQEEKDWFNNYFLNGQTTPVNWNIPDVQVPTLDALVKEFSFNHPDYIIQDVDYDIDKSGYISFVKITAQKK